MAETAPSAEERFVRRALAVRAFLLYLWSSHHFLEKRRTQAYHLVAGPGGRPR